MKSPGRLLIGAVVALFVLLIFGRSAAVFYTDALWFGAVGYADVFWTRLWAALGVRAVTGLFGGAVILANLWYVLRQLGPVHLRRRYGNLEIAEQVPRSLLVVGAVGVAAVAGWWLSSIHFGGNMPVAMLAWLRRESWGVADPLFGHDLTFYILGLPIYARLLDFLIVVIVWSMLLVAIGYVLVGAVRVSGTRWQIDDRPRVHFAILVAAILVVFAARHFLGRYLLLLDGGGFGDALGYTDVHARMPARTVVAVLACVTAGTIVYGVARRRLLAPALAILTLLLAAAGMGVAYPAIVQKLQVEPNQLEREAEYIRWNLEFTRAAYGLDAIERRRFEYTRATTADWVAALPILGQLPLWDPEPLQTAFNEIQAQRGYYQFPDVDYDRYGPVGEKQQVAVAVREFTQEGLNDAARTWQTIHLNPIFTRGMGVVASPVAPRQIGNPVYWLGDLHPVQRHDDAPTELDLREPSVYFGETMTDYAVVAHEGSFSRAADQLQGSLPSAPEVTTGIMLNSFARVLAFAWRFGDQNLLFATELGDTSRLIFRRTVLERVGYVAPFLVWDRDPHPVVLDGRVVWLIDGYTASSNYPLSRPYELAGGIGRLSYMRSSVKATVDAVTGDVRLYVIGEADPLLRTYRRVFPNLMRDESEMPPGLREHLRYPPLMFRLQADVLEEYHLEQPELFYAGQDVWQLPQEISPTQQGRYRPPFTMVAMPGGTEPEFLLINPFIARERQNMTALLIARSDGAHYGELVLLQVPREDQVKGPAQVQSIIEQDPVISQQLSLWRQRGTGVEMGRLRILPTAQSILFIEPLYLAASESPNPQLQRVVVSDGTAVAMGEDLHTAVALLTGEAVARAPAQGAAPALPSAPESAGDAALSRRALDLMREADARLRAGDFAGFGVVWQQLRALLEGGSQQPNQP